MNNNYQETSKSEHEETAKKIFVIRKIKKFNFWSSEDDKLLLKLSSLPGPKNWMEISRQFINKSPVQCSARYLKIKPGIKKGHWSFEEDKMIANYVAKFGRKWSKIGKMMTNRTGKQVRDRYLNYIDIDANRGRFTKEEDTLIRDLYIKHGTKWTTISRSFDKRTPEMIKNRFYSFLRSKIHINENRKSTQSRMRFIRRTKFEDSNKFVLPLNSINQTSEFQNLTIHNSPVSLENTGNSFFIEKVSSFSIFKRSNKNEGITRFEFSLNEDVSTFNFPDPFKILNDPRVVIDLAKIYIQHYEKMYIESKL